MRLSRVSKRYASLWALRDVTLEVAAGEFVALAGANGSGKTTLLKVMALIARPSGGDVTFSGDSGGWRPADASVKSRIGLVAHNTMLYDELSAGENIGFFARLYGMNPGTGAESLLESVGLIERQNSLVRTFSRGMRQRLALARALLHSPGLLLLDEPAAGLDAEGQQWLANMLADLHRNGCTVVMSTHGAGEAASLATRRVRLESGRVVESQ